MALNASRVAFSLIDLLYSKLFQQGHSILSAAAVHTCYEYCLAIAVESINLHGYYVHMAGFILRAKENRFNFFFFTKDVMALTQRRLGTEFPNSQNTK